eukprot:jgi/Mesvir1/12556/Mv21760-RA.1
MLGTGLRTPSHVDDVRPMARRPDPEPRERARLPSGVVQRRRGSDSRGGAEEEEGRTGEIQGRGDATPQAHRRTDCVSDTRPDYLVVARAVREAMGASITRLYCEGDGLKRVYQAWSHHKMCRNVDREHVSNNVWFEITCRGVSQRCHDDDCKGYASPPVPLPPAYYRRLFVSPAGADTSAPLPTPALAPAPATAGKTASSTTASSRVLAGLLLAKVGYDPSKIVYGRSWKGKKSGK